MSVQNIRIKTNFVMVYQEVGIQLYIRLFKSFDETILLEIFYI